MYKEIHGFNWFYFEANILIDFLGYLMHKMCAEMISTALRSQAPPPSYQAASTLPPVITYIGSNKKKIGRAHV